MGNHIDQFLDQKYINLETYKKDGTPVRTPVWFVIDNDLIYVITRDSTGKVKRLGNNQDVQIVSCSFKGEPKNEWIKGKAEKITGKEADIAIKLRKKKYGMSARLIGLFTSQKGNLVVYSIKIMD
jgi:PPOX class probable F420-dependent enzyme